MTHYVINDTGTGTSNRLVPADQFHQSLDTGPAAITDAPIRTPTAARDAAPTVENAPASPEGTTVPRDAASRGDPASERGEPASEERAPGEAEKSGDTPEAKASEEDANAAGDGDPTVQTGDRPGGLRSEEGEEGPSTHEEEDPTSTRGVRARRVFDDATMDRWARNYADKVDSDRPWSWEDDMDPNIPDSVQGEIKDRAISKGWIADIPIDTSVAPKGFANFQGYILKEVQMPHFITKRNGDVVDLWKAKDDVQFRWLNRYLRKTGDPNFTQSGGTWHHHQGGGINEGANGPGRPDGTMQLVRFGIHNITGHEGGRSPGSGRWASGPR